MAERTEGSVEIEAGPGEIMEVLLDFESYPDWAELRSVEVLSRDREGRGREVAMEVGIPVLGDARYTLVYEYQPDDGGMSWTTKEAEGPIRSLEGAYVLEQLNGDTRVTYQLAVELSVSVPGFLKRKADRRVIDTALNGLKSRVEGG